jgi:hypothetical protein
MALSGHVAEAPGAPIARSMGGVFARTDIEFRRRRLNSPDAPDAATKPSARDYSDVCVRELSRLANRPADPKRRHPRK